MPDTPQLPNGWNAWGNHVLKALEANDDEHKDIKSSLNELIVKIAVLETRMAQRAGVMGTISGSVAAIVVGVIIWLVTK